MNSFFTSKWAKLLKARSAGRRDSSLNRSRRNSPLIGLESLEGRQLLTTVPISGIISASVNYSDTTVLYEFTGNTTIQSGVAVTFGPKVNIKIDPYVTVTDQGTLSLGSGSTLTEGIDTSYGAHSTTGLVVAAGGTLSATGATVNRSGDYNGSNTYVSVAAGGHMTATNTTFSTNNVTLVPNSVLNATDLTGDAFNTYLSVPILDVPSLSNNKVFQTIAIDDGSLAAGQTVALNQIGTNHDYTGLVYRFGNFNVQSGATLAVGAGANVHVFPYATVTDNGTLSLGSGSTLTEDIDTNYGARSTTGLVVSAGGTLTATGATVNRSGDYNGSNTYVTVATGGHMTATNTTFSTNNVTLLPNSILGATDLTGDAFNTYLSVPILDVPLLSNNKVFQTIAINDGSLPSGQTVALNQIGTNHDYTGLVYRFGNFTVQSGATLAVGAAANVHVFPYATVTDNGKLSLGSGSTLTEDIDTNYGARSTTGLVVGAGGTLTATGATVNRSGDYNGSNTYVTVASGGRMTATNTTFSTNNVTLLPNSLLSATDLTGDAFNTYLSVPILDVPFLSNNKVFQTIAIDDGSLLAGQTVALNQIGTNRDYTGLVYRFGNFTVQSGATLTLGSGANVHLGAYNTLADNGTLSLGSGSSLTEDIDTNYGARSTTALVVGAGGTINATGATVNRSGDYNGSNTYVNVVSGGHFSANNSFFGTNQLYLAAGSIDNVAVDTLSTQLFVDIAASLGSGISGNDLSSGSVVATGAYSATKSINLSGNYWGTPTPGYPQITDYSHNNGLPVVNAASTLTVPSPAGLATVISVTPPPPATYNGATQSVTLSANVNEVSSGPAINGGTVTFTVLNGGRNLGKPIVVPVVNGVATTGFTVPAGLGVGSYSILACYSGYVGTANYVGAMDSSQRLTISQASANTHAIANPQTFAAGQSATLSAVVTSPFGNVSGGTETFTLLNGSTVIGSPVTAAVVNGIANASYPIPAGTAPGTYTVGVVYNGSPNFAPSGIDQTQTVTVSTNATTISTVGATAVYSTSSQPVTLTANVSSTAGALNEGTVTFTILSGTTSFAAATSSTIVNGLATITLNLPANFTAADYTIQAVYNGTANYGGSVDTTQHLTITPAATQAAGSNATAAATQTVLLSANVTSAVGTVNQGSVTFTVLNGTTVIGKAITAGVTGGVATAAFTVPLGTLAATYTIQAQYNGTANFTASVDTAHTLTVVTASATTTTLTSGNVNFVYNPTSAQPLNLTAHVASTSGVVNEGTVTFQILHGTTIIESAITVPVVNGTASTTGYTLPAGTAAGSYVISAVYNDLGGFLGSSDLAHQITVSAASTTLTTASATASVSPLAQSVSLTSTVVSGPLSVTEGIVTFTIFSSDGKTKEGQSVQGTVVNGVVTVSYTLPANLAAGTYIIQAVYTDPTGNFSSFTDTSKRLVLS